MAEVSQILPRVLRLFPQNYSFAFAYGSAVFRQGGDVPKRRMLDFIIAVDDPVAWHAENLKRNPRHYSLLRLGGANLISTIQQDLGANIYFNTLVPFENKLIKYGVISTNKLITDLLDWETLYVSGRLHKPVLVLKESKQQTLNSALKVNLHSALHAALLQLPEVFTEQDLYLHLAGLSYKGDFRMMLGENRNKVFNIVTTQVDKFRQLYGSHIKTMNQVVYWDESKRLLEQDCSSSARLHHLNLIPKQLQHRLVNRWHRDGRYLDVEEILSATAQDVDCAEMISIGIEEIVRKSSWTQTMKGIITAGLIKSVRYGGSKFFKMLRSLHR